MATIRQIGHSTVGDALDWSTILHAIESGHKRPRATISDQFLQRGDDTLLSRSAWIDGLGFGVKSVSVMPKNNQHGLPSVQGAMLVFDDNDGTLRAILDSDLVTRWKTAGDSVLGARLLARPDSERLLIVGAGVVAGTLVKAYSETFPGLTHIGIWNRTRARAKALAGRLKGLGFAIDIEEDLPMAAQNADIIATATMARAPVLMGDWVTPGTHVDLIGAFKSDMREADDALLQKGRLFVDSFDTTLDHIGELMIPLKNGVIQRKDVIADMYDLVQGAATGRRDVSDITIFKNGGGAHLDLMVAVAILSLVTLA